MKKAIAFTLAFLLLLSMTACGRQAEETTPATTAPAATEAPTETPETTEPTIPAPTEPEWEAGISRAGYGEAVYRRFAAGEQLKIVGKFRSYYVVEQEDVNLLVNRDLIRLATEPGFESWDGYALYGTQVFADPYFRGEPIATLRQNTPITVLESHGNWAFIRWAEGEGYIKVNMVSKWHIPSSSGGSGGSGKGPSDGTDVPIGSLTSADSTCLPQIHLLGGYYGPETETPFEETTATVLVQDTEGYICILLRGDEVRVTASDDTTATIWLGEDIYAQVPRWIVKLAGDPEAGPRTGYSKWDGIVYEEYQLRTALMTLYTNKQVTILEELETCYVVEVDGQIGYMALDKVSPTKASAGGSGGGSSVGGPTWTPPAL